jgi:hydrogenase maturation protein HypF
MTTAANRKEGTMTRVALERRRLTITGVVQGVGFRPFTHRLATELGLTGFVGNDARAVFAEIQGPPAVLDEFTRRLRSQAPPLSLITSVTATTVDVRGAETEPEEGFRIVDSRSAPGSRTLVPPDVATCDDCLRELFDPADRRYRHPFITCTNCGPRFTIITDLPYDRPNTTMAGFGMCERCAVEYHDPSDRRFHAQPVACPGCGPTLRLISPAIVVAASSGAGREGTTGDGPAGEDAIAEARRILADGGILAVKGIGGYHLACRADDEGAVAELRRRKARDGKPFAVLTRNLATARRLAVISEIEEAVLASPARPIVLLHRRTAAAGGAIVAPNVAPGNPLLGLMLPYSPVHHLLLDDSRSPGARDTLVFTSANITDEPLCYTEADERDRLPRLADAVLTHDRPIHVPCDDSVVRVSDDGSQLPLRRSRGYAPLPVPLGPAAGAEGAAGGGPVVLAVGAELKNSCCLTDGGSAFCSAHIGDMGNVETLRAFEKATAQLMTLHRARPDIIAADLHPSYLTRDWAEKHTGEDGEPELRLVQHHHAHVASLLAEHGRLGEPVIGVAFDGTGYGTDGTIWGGEILLTGSGSASGSGFERAGHLRAVPLPGGDAAVRNPCRIALSYLAAAGVPWDAALPPVAESTRPERTVLAAQVSRHEGTVPCTSMGRLFDAVSALIGVRERISYEAQAAIELEILAQRFGEPRAGKPCAGRLGTGGEDAGLPGISGWLPVGADGVIDWFPLIRALAAGVRAETAPAALARGFHEAVASAVVASAERVRASSGAVVVGLTGGVFQNVLLTRLCRERLENQGFEVLTHRLVPPNDGGLALGQAAIAVTEGTSGAEW